MYSQLKESDNVILIEVINNGIAVDNNLSEVRLIYIMMLKDWHLKFRHVSREQNKITNNIVEI